MGMSLWQEIRDKMAELDAATASARKSGVDAASAEATYQRNKNIRALQIRAEGVPWTGVQLLIKGDTAVNGYLLDRDTKVALHDADVDLVNTLKVQLRILMNEYQREYGSNRPY